jgi:hypothetical protein
MPGKIQRWRNIMYLNNGNFITGETYDPPRIEWHEQDKYAIIGFLLLNLDKKADKDGMVRFDDLFGLNEAVPEGEEEDDNAKEQRETRDAVIRECEKFLARLNDAERYDIILDEIDRFIEGEDGYNSTCAIGGSYATFGGASTKLTGGAYVLWDMVKLVLNDIDYNGGKKRLLKHLARKWDIDPAVLPQLETTAKNLAGIARERTEIKVGDRPYREVVEVLARLDAEETEAWIPLKKLGIAEDRATSAGIAAQVNLANAFRSAYGLKPDFKIDLNETKKEEDGETECDNRNAWDDIGDVVSEGITNFFGGIADGINDLALKISSW